jgi:hypothetical protein
MCETCGCGKSDGYTIYDPKHKHPHGEPDETVMFTVIHMNLIVIMNINTLMNIHMNMNMNMKKSIHTETP